MQISMIAAVGHNNVIGYKGDMPWGYLPADLGHFQKVTASKILIMGRVTYEGVCASMKKPLGATLPGRKIIIISKTQNLGYPISKDIIRASCVEDTLCKACWVGAGEIIVAGGESIYKMFMPHAQRLYMTYIDKEFPGDRFFPEFSEEDWKVYSQKDREPDEKNPYRLTFKTFLRKGKVANYSV